MSAESSALDRREFLARSMAGAGLLGLGGLGGACAYGTAQDGPRSRPAGPAFEISLAQWSLHRRLRGSQGKKLGNLEFAAAAKGLGIGAVEYVNQFFKDKAEDAKYLAEMRKRAGDVGVRSLLIMCDGEGQLGHHEEKRRAHAVDNHRKWVTAALALGCHSIRVNAASKGTYDEQQKLAADGLQRLTEFADGHEINVLVENHGGLSSNGAWLAGVMKMVDHPRCGTLPDFGNFRLGSGKSYDRYKGVAELMPFAKAVSAKSYDFDENGNETTIDFARMMKIVVAAGYRGHVGVEYEGRRLSEEDGILATKKLLERVRTALKTAPK